MAGLCSQSAYMPIAPIYNFFYTSAKCRESRQHLSAELHDSRVKESSPIASAIRAPTAKLGREKTRRELSYTANHKARM
jgi:hypothetical protein